MTEFRVDDRVLHTKQPEWGAGRVLAADPIMLDGKATQRLRIRFERAGLKTLLASHAPLRPAEDAGPFDRDEAVRKLHTLPEEATDPFATLSDRLTETLRLYRFTTEPAPLLDWAASRTGLADPLDQFSRPDLEQAFARFAAARDAALAGLLRDVRKTPPPDLAEILRDAPDAGRRALQRLHAAR